MIVNALNNGGLMVVFVMIISFIGYRIRFLTLSGMGAAIFVGVTIGFAFSYFGLIILGFFFGSSSLLGKVIKRKAMVVREVVKKDGARDGIQVFANGGPAALLAIVYLLTDGNEVVFFLFLGALAAANSDTWASELGRLSSKQPFSIFSFKRVATGTSGAVSFVGTIGAFVASLSLAILAFLFEERITFQIMLTLTGIGFAGSLFDTLLGGTVQALYKCKICGKTTEKTLHCNCETEHISGYKIMNNDVVNFVAITAACGLGYFFF